MSVADVAYQVLESVEADFDEMTWTFRIQDFHHVTGGHFAIVDNLPFTKALAKLSYAEQLLRKAADGQDIKEGAMSFFDPEPLV